MIISTLPLSFVYDDLILIIFNLAYDRSKELNKNVKPIILYYCFLRSFSKDLKQYLCTFNLFYEL